MSAAFCPLPCGEQEPYGRWKLPFSLKSHAPFFCGAFWADMSFSLVYLPFNVSGHNNFSHNLSIMNYNPNHIHMSIKSFCFGAKTKKITPKPAAGFGVGINYLCSAKSQTILSLFDTDILSIMITSTAPPAIPECASLEALYIPIDLKS